MTYIVSWVEAQSPTKINEQIKHIDHYEVFCDDGAEQDANKKYSELVNKMQQQADTDTGIYTVQLSQIKKSTEPQHFSCTLTHSKLQHF